jgi:hypothetical protein
MNRKPIMIKMIVRFIFPPILGLLPNDGTQQHHRSVAKVMSVAVTCCSARQPTPQKGPSPFVHYFKTTVMLDDADKINIEN